MTMAAQDLAAGLDAIKQGKHADLRLVTANDATMPVLRVFERGDHAELADSLLDELAPNAEHLAGTEGSIWRYAPADGYWRRIEVETMRRIVKSFAGSEKPSADGRRGTLRITAGAVDGAITLAAAEVYRPGFFDAVEPGVVFRNGFVTLQSGKVHLGPHTAGHRARAGFGFDYDPHAPRNLLGEFFDEVFADACEEERAAREATLQEFAGACMFGMATVYQQAMVCFGPGGTGKSEFAKILIASHPSTSVASIAPHRWAERFGLSHLVGVSLNVVSELPEAELVSTDAFKAVIVGDQVTGEKKYSEPFDFRPMAGHVFIANRLPPTSDVTDAFFRRFVIVPFTRNMLTAPTHKKEAGAQVVREQHPGVAAWAIEGAARLQQQGRYTIPAAGADLLTGWRRESDSVAMFVDERCSKLDMVTEKIVQGTKATTLYKGYAEWCKEHGFRSVNSRNFAHRMAGIGLRSEHTARGACYPVRLTSELGD